ncbi:MAG: hypothetical protein RLZZ453_1292 [Chlamydiota bacterium]|jgi:hypothetical protein
MWRSVYPVFLLSALLCLNSCFHPYYVSVCQKWVDARDLASSAVATPDPRQAHPPTGQMLIINWRVPQEVFAKQPEVVLNILFWDYSEKCVRIPIHHRMDFATYKLLDKEYEKTGGILTYKAEIVTQQGEVCYEWRHQLYVDLITISDDN